MAHTTTLDRVQRAARAAEHVETYGAPKGSFASVGIGYALAVIVVLLILAVVTQRWDAISADVAHCANVLGMGASDHPEAIRCAGVIG